MDAFWLNGKHRRHITQEKLLDSVYPHILDNFPDHIRFLGTRKSNETALLHDRDKYTICVTDR